MALKVACWNFSGSCMSVLCAAGGVGASSISHEVMGAVCGGLEQREVSHVQAPRMRACKDHSAAMVPGVQLLVASMRWVQVSSQSLSFCKLKQHSSASITITRCSRNISMAAICSAVVVFAMAVVVVVGRG